MPQSTKITLKIKGSKFRNKVALCLRTWRQTGSIKETSKITGINSVTTTSCLKCSMFYVKSAYNNRNMSHKICQSKTIKESRNEKHSAYRKHIATYLRAMRKLKSIKDIARQFNVSRRTVYYFLEQSPSYRKRYGYKKKHVASDSIYIIRWAKKIKAIKLLGGKCEKCGNTNIFHVDFHHKNKDDKTNKISGMLRGTSNDLHAEVLKCKLLCRNCHRELHNAAQKNKSAKLKLLLIQHDPKCQKCGYNKNLSALEFHHATNDKIINLFTKCSFRNNNGIPITNTLLKELSKCIVLCSNCHNEIHNNKNKFHRLKEKINLKIIDIVF